MINHIRTLLQNRSGDQSPSPDYPGEEFTPPTFRARQLPAFLKTALSLLFGASPDALYRNYRLRQALQLLHATELITHVTAPDPRITYDLQEDSFFDAIFRLEVDQYAGASTPLYGGGSHFADDGAGVSRLQWRLSALGGGQLQINRLTPPVSETIQDFLLENNLSQPIALPGSGLTVRFPSPPTGAGWLITSQARPGRDLGESLVQTSRALGEAGVDKIMAGAGDAAGTFANLWRARPEFAYKYGALLLAIAYYIEGLPQETP